MKVLIVTTEKRPVKLKSTQKYLNQYQYYHRSRLTIGTISNSFLIAYYIQASSHY